MGREKKAGNTDKKRDGNKANFGKKYKANLKVITRIRILDSTKSCILQNEAKKSVF